MVKHESRATQQVSTCAGKAPDSGGHDRGGPTHTQAQSRTVGPGAQRGVSGSAIAIAKPRSSGSAHMATDAAQPGQQPVLDFYGRDGELFASYLGKEQRFSVKGVNW